MTKICRLSDLKYREKLVETLETISSTVSSTLGPNGKTCILYDGDVIPHVTKDGVTVAEFIKFKDYFQEAINRIIKETARKTGETVGDGTTTSILLACKLTEAILKQDGNILQVLSETDTSIKIVIDKLRAATYHVDTFNDSNTIDILRGIINLSSNGDVEITKTIVDILNDVGPDALIDVIISNNEVTHVDIKEGMSIISPAHVNKSHNLKEPYVVLVSNAIEKGHQFLSCLKLSMELYASSVRPMIVIAKEFSKEIQDLVSVNNRGGRVSIFLVETDGFAMGMFEILDDMAALLNCKIMSTDAASDYGLQNVTLAHLSKIVVSAVVTPQHTVLQSNLFLTPENLEIKQSIINEIIKIRQVGENKTGEFRQLEKRLAKFSKSATIYVGGFTDAEKAEKKDRVDDAVKALASAVNNGVIPGGGLSLYLAGSESKSEIVKEVCKIPGILLSQNYSVDICKIFDTGSVMDFVTEEVGEAFELGILDPADVLIKALQQAMVIVKLLLNTHSIIIPDDGEV